MEAIASELKTKDSLVCNAVSLWQSKNQTAEFPTKEQIKEIIEKEKDLDLAIPSYTVLEFTGDRMAFTDKNNNIFLYNWYKSNSSDYFFNYITGNINSQTSQQKKEVFRRLEKDGYTLDRIKELLNTNKLINSFLLYHEMSHIQNNDKDVYWGENNDNRDLMSEDKIQIEYRATLDALQKTEKFKKLLENNNEASQNPETNTPIITNIGQDLNIPANSIFYSGAANGADQAWGKYLREKGYEVKDITTEDWDSLSQEDKQRYEKTYKEVVSIIGRKELDPNTSSGKLVRRDIIQADKATAVFAISTLGKNGIVNGGTAYATYAAVLQEKPVY
jgi:hypothetical protein